MILSTQTHHATDVFGDGKGIELLALAGFDALDYSLFAMARRKEHPDFVTGDEFLNYARSLRQHVESYGIRFNQIHAPFDGFARADREEIDRTVLPIQIRSIEFAGLLGAKTVVVHPMHHDYRGHEEELFEKNMYYYRALESACDACGVRVAVENMWDTDKRRGFKIDDVCSRAEELARYVDELGTKHFTACLDLGHCGLTGGEAPEMIRKLGAGRLGALHVHDNDYIGDLHTLPGLGKMPWREIMQALGEIGYRGDFTFEADDFLAGFEKEFLPTAFGFMERRGRFLLSMLS